MAMASIISTFLPFVSCPSLVPVKPDWNSISCLPVTDKYYTDPSGVNIDKGTTKNL